MIHHNIDTTADTDTHGTHQLKFAVIWSFVVTAVLHLWNYLTGDSVSFLSVNLPNKSSSMEYFLQWSYLVGLLDYLIKAVLLIVVTYPVKILLDWVNGKPVGNDHLARLFKRIVNVFKKSKHRPPTDRLGR